MKKKNIKKIPYVPMLIITAFFGIVYAVLTNLFIDKLLAEVWKPLVVAIYFTIFAVLISVVIFIVAEIIGGREKMPDFFKSMSIFMAVLFFATMIFEVIYEIGLKTDDIAANAYIIVVDDSGSMESNDPQQKRSQAIKDIVSDQANDFEYAIYLFADSSQLVRKMNPKSKGVGSIQLNSSGGTSIGGTLSGILNDIESGLLKVKENTRVILLSDGAATDIGFFNFSLNKILDGYVDANIVISTVGLGSSVDVDIMEKIAKKTGGVYIHADNDGQLSSAMMDASIYSANRSLIGTRGYCKTDILHAIMRIVFILVICAIVNLIKITIGGESKNMQFIVGCISSISAALFIEIALENIGVGEDFTRVIFCVLLAAFIVNKIVRIKNKNKVNFDFGEIGADEDDSEMDDYSSLNTSDIGRSEGVNSLGEFYGGRRK